MKIKVKTATIQLNVPLPPYWLIAVYGLAFAITVKILVEAYLWQTYSQSSMIIFERLIGLGFFGAIGGAIGSAVGAENSQKIDLEIEKTIKNVTDRTIIGAIFGAAIFGAIFKRELLAGAIGGVILGALFWAIICMIYWTIKKVQTDFYQRGFNQRTITLYVILTTTTGILTGLGTAIGFNFYLLAGLTASALPLVAMSIYPPLKLRKLKAQYRRQESQNLIEP